MFVMADSDFDVAVVGSGPAGACAARWCAQRGLAVVLIERETLPRYKTCGGGVVPRAAGLMGIDIASAVQRVSRVIELHVPGLAKQVVEHDGEALIYMTMRDTLDALLTESAVAAGVTLHAGCSVTGLEQHDDRVMLATDDGPIAARYVLAADGAKSMVAKLAGWSETRRFAPALECEVRVDEPTMQRLGQATRFDFDFIRGGYAWVFPKREHLSIGLGRLREAAGNLNAGLRRYLDVLGIDADTPMERHGYVVPISARRDGFTRGRVLLLGDAAGFADPVAAEGISHAVISARCAAEAVCDGRDAAGVYERLIERDLMPELRAAEVLSRLLYEHRLLRAVVLRLQQRRAARAMVDVFSGRRTFTDVLRRRSWLLRYILGRAA